MNACSSSACGLSVNPKRDLKMQALVKTKESVNTENIDFMINKFILINVSGKEIYFNLYIRETK